MKTWGRTSRPDNLSYLIEITIPDQIRTETFGRWCTEKEEEESQIYATMLEFEYYIANIESWWLSKSHGSELASSWTISFFRFCRFSLFVHWLIRKQMVPDFVEQEDTWEVIIGNAEFMLLLYANDVVLLANTSRVAQKLMRALEEFCMCSKLSVNGSKNIYYACEEPN